MLVNPYASLSDQAVEEGLFRKAETERETGYDIILYLHVVRQRLLYAPAGYDSIYTCCRKKLGFSKSTSYRRKTVVEKIDDFPCLVDRLRDGRLQLCAVTTVAPYLEKATAEELLDAIEGMSYRDVEAFLVKKWAARQSVQEAATRKSVSTSSNVETAAPMLALVMEDGAKPMATEMATAEVVTPQPNPMLRKRTIIKHVTEDACRVSITLSDKTLEAMQRAKEILGKADDEVLLRALETLLEQIASERRAARRKARQAKKAAAAKQSKSEAKSAASTEQASLAADGAKNNRRHTDTGSRRGKLADRDQAMVEGGLRCCFVAADGTRCDAKAFLHLDHVQPWALGGPSTPENTQPMCATHNQYRARQTFGPYSKPRGISRKAVAGQAQSTTSANVGATEVRAPPAATG